jgi:hypothetical protein
MSVMVGVAMDDTVRPVSIIPTPRMTNWLLLDGVIDPGWRVLTPTPVLVDA